MSSRTTTTIQRATPQLPATEGTSRLASKSRRFVVNGRVRPPLLLGTVGIPPIGTPSEMRIRAVVTTLVVLGLAVGASGCSDSHDPNPTRSSAARTGPGFSGPWASLFESAYRESKTVDERNALEDGEVSDKEYSYFRQKIIECLAAVGVTANWGAEGALDYSRPSNVSNDDVQRCNQEGGLSILLLRDAILRNPDNLDEGEIMAACLRRIHAVPPNFTARDLAAGRDLDRLSKADGFSQCEVDPLHFGLK